MEQTPYISNPIYTQKKKKNSFMSWFGGKDRNHHEVDSISLKSDRILKK